MLNPPYTTPNVVGVLRIADQLHQEGSIVLEHLREHVELGLEASQPGGSIKWFCTRSTLDKYLKLTRGSTDALPVGVQRSFRYVLKAVSEPAFYLIVEYLERVRPGATHAINSELSNVDA